MDIQILQEEVQALKIENENLKSSKMDHLAQLPHAFGSDQALGDQENLKIENEKRGNEVLAKPEEPKVSKEELERIKRERKKCKAEERKATQDKLEKMEKEIKTLTGKLKEKEDELESLVSQEREDEIKRMILLRQELDLVFLVHVDSKYEGMQVCINLIKRYVAKLASEIKEELYPECKLRVGFAPYRDYVVHKSTKYDAEPCDLTDIRFTGVESLFVRALPRVGPGRGKGDAIQRDFRFDEYVPSFSWNARNKLLFHIYYMDNEERLLKNIEKKVIDKVANKVGDSAVGGLLEICHIRFQTMPTELDVVKLCRRKVQKTLDAPPEMLKYLPQEEDETVLPFKSYPKSFYNKQKWHEDLDKVIGKIRNKEPIGEDVVKNVQVQIKKISVADERDFTWQYPATVTVPGEAPRHTFIRRFKTPWEYKDMPEDCQKRDYYLAQMEVQSVATQMAREFNRISSNFTDGMKLEFTRVNLLGLVLGNVTKFANMDVRGGGDMRPSIINLKSAECEEVLQAFTHWTHERSEKLLMVRAYSKGAELMTDNAREGDVIIRLHDPVVHCKSDVMRFNTHICIDMRTNLGLEGFKLFFHTHECNKVCKELNLLPEPEP